MTDFVAEAQQFLAHLPGYLLRSLVLGLGALLVFFVAYRLTDYAQRVAYRIVKRRRPEGGETLARAGGRIVWIVGLVVSIILTLRVLGVNFGALLAALGLSTVVLGLALKDVIEQAVTGTLLLVQRPFHVGDTIQVEGVEGTVVDVAVRTTNIRTFDGVHALIPNNKVYQSVIKNKSYYPARRFGLDFGLEPGSDLAAARDRVLAAVARVPGVLPDPAPVVAFEGWEQDSIRTTVRFWVNTTDDPVAVQTAATQSILGALRAAGLGVRVPGQAGVVSPPA